MICNFVLYRLLVGQEPKSHRDSNGINLVFLLLYDVFIMDFKPLLMRLSFPLLSLLLLLDSEELKSLMMFQERSILGEFCLGCTDESYFSVPVH